MKRLLCLILGHRFFVCTAFSYKVRCVGCKRCHQFWGMHEGVRALVPWDGELSEHHNFSPFAFSLLLISLICSALPAQAQDFSLRLGASCEGSAQPHCGGSLGLVIGGGDNRSVSTVTMRYLQDGRFSQSYATGIERTLFSASVASLFTCGQVGVAIVGENRSGLAAGCLGLATAPFWKRPGFAASVVPLGWARNVPAEGGEWDGGVSVSVQFDFARD